MRSSKLNRSSRSTRPPRFPSQYVKHGVARVFVANQTQVLADSYTLSAARIAAETLPDTWHKTAVFYQHFGVIELPGQPGRWMRPRIYFTGLA